MLLPPPTTAFFNASAPPELIASARPHVTIFAPEKITRTQLWKSMQYIEEYAVYRRVYRYRIRAVLVIKNISKILSESESQRERD
jgi:hypothetical protein